MKYLCEISMIGMWKGGGNEDSNVANQKPSKKEIPRSESHKRGVERKMSAKS